MNKKFYGWLGLIGVCIFGFFAFIVHKDLLINFDFDTTVKLQDFIPRWFDTFFSSFSLLGSVEITTLGLLILVILNRKISGLGVLFLYVLALVIEIAGKTFINHPGPPAMFHRYDIPITMPSFYVHPGFAFPSGHSMRTAFLAVMIFYMSTRSKKLGGRSKFLILCFIFLLSLIMYLSRVYLGEHWSTDVIGGILLGTGFAALAVLFL